MRQGPLVAVAVCAALGTACSGTPAEPSGGGGVSSGGMSSGGTASAGTLGSGSSPAIGGSAGRESASGGTQSAGVAGWFASGGAMAGAAGAAVMGGARGGVGGASANGGKTMAGDGGLAGSTNGAGQNGSAGSAGSTNGAGQNGSGGSAGSGGHAGAGAATTACSGTSAGYKLVWSDEFDGPAGSAVDAKNWTYDVGGTGWGNNELQYYTSGASNAALDGAGNLVLTAKRETREGKNYTSARVKTQGLREFTFGRVEARIKIATGQGIWPAFWMLGNDIGSASWPACGEIDIMENRGREPNIVLGTLHGPGYSGAAGPTQAYTSPTPFHSAFHVFAIEWEQTQVRWYIDGALFSTKTSADIPSGANWVYTHPFFIILNLAVGGEFGGDPDSTTMFPQTMQIDYVRVCQK